MKVSREGVGALQIDCHFIRHHLLPNNLSLALVPSDKQTTHIFTKSLLPVRFHHLASKLKLTSVSSS